MEIVIIEKEAFEAFMAEVSALTEKVDRLCARGAERQLKKWMDGEDVCHLLRLSRKRCRGCVTGASSPVRRWAGSSITGREDVERLVSEKREETP